MSKKLQWETPELVLYDTLVEVTGQGLPPGSDKCGSRADFLTTTIPNLDGDVVPEEDCDENFD